MTTAVAVTFDIEFDINGTFIDPISRKPRGREAFFCSKNENDVTGLDKILECLAAHSIKATFFVEALQTAWFGLSEMGDIAHKIHQQGHELQLHLHPVWLLFDQKNWAETVSQRRPVSSSHDSLVAVPRERACEIVERGLEIFKQWNLPAPTAVRTGSLIIERPLYKVFSECGLKISSSVGLGLYQPKDPSLHLFNSAHHFDEVTELPISSFLGADPLLRRQRRLATVIGMGKYEQDAFLKQSKKMGAPFVVILSHVSEFLMLSRSGVCKPNVLTTSKFEALCGAVEKDTDLRAVTIDELACSNNLFTTGSDLQLSVPRIHSVLRFAERAVY